MEIWELLKSGWKAIHLRVAFRIFPKDSFEVRWAKAYRNMDELVISLKEDFQIQQRERNRLDVLKDAFRKGCTSEAQMNQIKEVSESLALVSKRIARQKGEHSQKQKLIKSCYLMLDHEIPRY
ncbi:MAG: hypothetical protein BWY24_00437 [Microgenomates group bacterium ADurb.Bin219]|nr:MAG: hypothetical protein BWY24_00437 [Microgenomates group bacterium ADurb.Bin219]HNP89390.1 hypothetical protein [Candidatus Woesebacteria bacterium]